MSVFKMEGYLHKQDKVTHAEFKKRFMPLQRMLYRQAFRMLCDQFEAEDAVQNLYLKLWEQKEILDSIVSPDAYCRRILRNICIDRWRMLRVHEDILPLDETIAGDAPPDTEQFETKEFVEHFLAGLPEQHRRVMQMRMQGFGFDEIAEVTGEVEVNVRVIISRARKRFREIYYKNQGV